MNGKGKGFMKLSPGRERRVADPWPLPATAPAPWVSRTRRRCRARGSCGTAQCERPDIAQCLEGWPGSSPERQGSRSRICGVENCEHWVKCSCIKHNMLAQHNFCTRDKMKSQDLEYIKVLFWSKVSEKFSECIVYLQCLIFLNRQLQLQDERTKANSRKSKSCLGRDFQRRDDT